tara:strand:+ start:193 stop:354 length:162 start_codon:yes stop_codon:yes gene_type:complete
MLIRKIFFIILFSISYGQKLNQDDFSFLGLDYILQLASRSEQKVFVEDFTGLQ